MCTRRTFLETKHPAKPFRVLVLCDSHQRYNYSKLQFRDKDRIQSILRNISLTQISLEDLNLILRKENISDNDIVIVGEFVKEIVQSTSTSHTQAKTWNNITYIFNKLGIPLEAEYHFTDPEYIVDIPKINMYRAYFGKDRKELISPSDKLFCEISNDKFDIIFDAGCMNAVCIGSNFITPTGLIQIRNYLDTSNGWGLYLRYNTVSETADFMYCSDYRNVQGIPLRSITRDTIDKMFPIGLSFGNIKSKATGDVISAFYKLPPGSNYYTI